MKAKKKVATNKSAYLPVTMDKAEAKALTAPLPSLDKKSIKKLSQATSWLFLLVEIILPTCAIAFNLDSETVHLWISIVFYLWSYGEFMALAVVQDQIDRILQKRRHKIPYQL